MHLLGEHKDSPPMALARTADVAVIMAIITVPRCTPTPSLTSRTITSSTTPWRHNYRIAGARRISVAPLKHCDNPFQDFSLKTKNV